MHISVLKSEAISNLNIKDSGVYVDATLGYAGDSSEILKRAKKGFLYAFDADMDAIKYSDEVLKKIGSNYKLIHDNFINMDKYLDTSIDGYLFDLGVSSPEIDNPERGFSFMSDAPLDMRMNTSDKVSARTIVNTYSEKELADIFYKYAEEPRSREIAKEIVKSRKNKEIVSTLELVNIIHEAVGSKYFYSKHPERVIFQALRIGVNHELDAIENALEDALKRLSVGGRIVVITFHSLEDRMVKNIFNKYTKEDEMLSGDKDIPDEYIPKYRLVNKKVITPSREEIENNPRSKSAKMRVIERISL